MLRIMRPKRRAGMRLFSFEATAENTAFLIEQKRKGYSYFATINAALYAYRKTMRLHDRLEALKKCLHEHDAKQKPKQPKQKGA